MIDLFALWGFKMIPAKVDEFGREVEKAVDTWYPRRGVAVAIGQLAPLITSELVGDLMHFFVFNSLSDRNETVRKEMLNAALKIVDIHGKVIFYCRFTFEFGIRIISIVLYNSKNSTQNFAKLKLINCILKTAF